MLIATGVLGMLGLTAQQRTASPEVHRLSNGLSVILARDTSLPIVAVAVSYHVGGANEEAGRREFAHLFEHLMLSGSEQVAVGMRNIQEAGGRSDATTDFDRTYYYHEVPSHYLEFVLWLEATRMALPLGEITQSKLEVQRSVVRNEHRQRRENVPYGMAFWRALSALYPAGHPYALATSDWLADLDAATVADVQSFHARFYGPSNATLAIVGNFNSRETLRFVQRYFGDTKAIPAIERPRPAPVRLAAERHVLLEDRVELPALFLMWPTDRAFARADADLKLLAHVLGGGRNSRLHKRLVEQDKVARSVSASQESWALAGQFVITVYAASGHDLRVIRDRVDEELARLLEAEPPTAREVARAVHHFDRLFAERTESALQRAILLTTYATFTGKPAFGDHDFTRFAQATPTSLQAAARQNLGPGRVVLSVVPRGKTQLQAIR